MNVLWSWASERSRFGSAPRLRAGSIMGLMSATLPRDLRRELEALRERAYGPRADIATDPDAAARLTELEELSRRGDEQGPGESPITDADVRADPDGPLPGPEGTEPASVTPVLPVPRVIWWRHPGAVLTVGAALAVGLVAGLTLPVLWTSRPDIVAALDRDALVDPTEAWIRQAERALDVDPGTLQQYEQVEGVTMWTGASADGARCLIVVWGELWGNGSCAPDPLDPVVDFRVNPDIPMPLASSLEDGGVVRFVARGDVVEIWVREPAGRGPELNDS